MIRHVSVCRFHEGTSQEDIDALTDALLSMDLTGVVNRSAGPALGLRERDADYMMVFDFEDEDAFWRFDKSPQHDELRAGLAPKIIESGATAQIEI